MAQQKGCEIMKCDYYVDGKCTDPNEWVNESGDAVCGLRNDAILVEKEKPTPMAQQTAVEFIETELVKLNIPTDSGTQVSVIRIFEQANKMFEEQIIKAHGLKYYDLNEEFITGEQYYNETYKQQ